MAEEPDTRGPRPLPLELTRQDLLKYGLVAGYTTFFLGACGGGKEKAATSTKVTNPVPKTKPDQLIVRAWGDPWRKFWDDTAAKAFTAETGITVKWDTTDTGELMTKVRAAIGAGQRPPVDAAMSDSVQGYLAHVQKLSLPLDPKVATALSAQNQDVIKPGFKIPELSMVGMYSYSVPLNYRKDKVKNPKQALDSWSNLATDFDTKSVALTTGYQWLSFPMAKTLGVDPETEGMDAVFAAYKDLKPNVLGLLNDTQITNFLISGEAAVALAISGDGLAAEKEGADIGYAVPREGMVLDRDFYLVFDKTPPEVRYYANVFANHLYDAATQTKLADTLGVVPAAPKATLPAYMKKDPLIYPFTPEQIGGNIILPIPLAAKHAEDWQAAYEEALK